jgi:hypothetical protein
MSRGELSFSQVRALTRVATPETEEVLLELARGASTASLEGIVRSWKRMSRLDEAEWEGELHRSRCFSVFPDEEGMYVVKGRLELEVAALLMRAVEAASDALFREEGKSVSMGTVAMGTVSMESETERGAEARRRRADALALLAERALAAGFGTSGEDLEGIRGDGAETPISGTRAARYQVVLHVDAATLSEDQEPGRSELEDGTRVSAEPSDRDANTRSAEILVRETFERSEKNVSAPFLRRECRPCDTRIGTDGGVGWTEWTGWAGWTTRLVWPGGQRLPGGRHLRRIHPRCGAPDPDDLARPPARPRDTGPWMPVPGVRAPLHRCASPPSLGGRG